MNLRDTILGWMIIVIFWGLQDRKTNRGASTFTQSSSRQQSADSTPVTKSTVTQQGSEGMASILIEKRKKLLKRCQGAIKTISKMRPQQQRQMAALASEADGGLKASGRILSGAIKVPNPDAPKQMLDDVEFFVDEITRCSESAKQGKPCSLSTDAQAVLRSFTESDKAKALRSLSTFCNE
jgi:hypothetical protein